MPAQPPRQELQGFPDLQPEEQSEPGPDAYVFGAPAPVPPAARPAPRRKGKVEIAVSRDLARMPDWMRKGGLAATALKLAAELDAGGIAPRDAAGYAREIRLCLAALADMAPGDARGDQTDEVRERRERRLAGRE